MSLFSFASVRSPALAHTQVELRGFEGTREGLNGKIAVCGPRRAADGKYPVTIDGSSVRSFLNHACRDRPMRAACRHEGEGPHYDMHAHNMQITGKHARVRACPTGTGTHLCCGPPFEGPFRPVKGGSPSPRSECGGGRRSQPTKPVT